MLVVTDRFLTALRDPHVVLVEADVVPAGGGPDVPLVVSGGSVVGDRTAQVRRQLTLELAGETVRELGDLLFGAYVKVRRGIRYADGSSELVQLGYFRVDDVGASDPGGTARLAGSDRMAQVRDEPILELFAAGGNIPSVRITDLVVAVFPGLAYDVQTTELEVLVDVTFTGDRAAAVAQLAQSIPGEAYFDNVGELVVAPPPTLLDAVPVWDVDAGLHGVLVASSESVTRDGVANGVLVRGQPSADAPPIEALVVDDTPGSPTLWGGPFGKVAVIVDSKAVQTVFQATEVGEAELAKRLGLQRTLNLTAVPNPALEPGDVIGVVLGDGTTETHIVDRLTIPLDVTGTLTVDTRTTFESPAPATAVYVGRDAWRELRGAELEVLT